MKLLLHWRKALQAIVASLVLIRVARADCECGYSTSVGLESDQNVFTDLIETDFRRLTNLSANTDWVGQSWDITGERARGRFGEVFSTDNLVQRPSGDRDAGLDLVVRSRLVDGKVPAAEVDSARNDILWGSFRAGIKLSATKGTCAAFFWYYNDTQEIDMEFLSKDFDQASGSFPVNLVLQSRAAAEAGYNAQATGDFKTVQLPFDPTAGVHEYRMDFLPGRVVFYADGRPLATMTGGSVPDQPGHLVLQHWSNGNALWSGGPPAQDAAATVAYVKAYFNSSAAARQADWRRRCGDAAAPRAVCQIPAAVDVADPGFFSAGANMTNNQTLSAGGFSQPRSTSSSDVVRTALPLAAVPFLIAAGMWGVG